jgi:DNA-binding transcriptional regulator YiaG
MATKKQSKRITARQIDERVGQLQAGTMTPAAVKALRMKLGVTVEAFAVKLSVTPKTVARWESGESKVQMPYSRDLLALKNKVSAKG